MMAKFVFVAFMFFLACAVMVLAACGWVYGFAWWQRNEHFSQ